MASPIGEREGTLAFRLLGHSRWLRRGEDVYKAVRKRGSERARALQISGS